MKKTLLFAVLAFFAAGLAFGGTITVTQPAGGTVTMGAATPIVWTASNVAVGVKIQLIRQGGALVGQLADNIAAGGSPWSWTVAAPAVVGETYRIRVRAMDGSAEGASAAFIVAAPSPAASIQVSQPSSTSTWHKNEAYAITWTKTGSMPNAVQISLMDKNSTSVVREIVDGAQNGGSWPWTPPADLPFGQYRVRVLVKNTDIKDDSDTFSVAVANSQPGITTAKSHSLQLNPTPADSCPDCEKYEEHPQIRNWGNFYNRGDWIFNNIDHARPKGYPQGDSNAYARVGYDYYTCAGTYGPVWTTHCYRSSVWVNMVGFQSKIAAGYKLVSARLHLRQVSSLIAGDTSDSCATGVFIFLAPWTDFWNFQVTVPPTGTAGLEFGLTDYSKDITDIVRKWLDGTWPNCGLLLVSREVHWGEQAKTCYSGFDVHMTLWFKKN
jgi:hypothetical protein